MQLKWVKNEESWNPVLNKFVEIKCLYEQKLGSDSLWNYDKNVETCLEYWARKLGNSDYIELLKPLQLNEYDEMLLIRYGNDADVFGGEIDMTPDEFWTAYDGFYMECRSVVIDIKNDCLILTPFRKFRNLNECEETSFENISQRIKNAKCVEFSEKLDGSMQSARWYDGRIVMAGSMALNPADSWRLADGRRMLEENENYINMLKDFPNETFVFEYISQKDAHVVKYSKEQEGLYLIGIREVITGTERPYCIVHSFAKAFNIPTAMIFDKTLDEVVSELDDKKSSEAEGFVLNIDGFKVKIKYNDYVNMHKVLSSISSINLIIKSIADDNFDDVLAKIPNAYKDRVLKIAGYVFKYIKDTEDIICNYYSSAPKDNKKDFMIWVDNNVPRDKRGYVRAKYLGHKYNLIKTDSGKYLKLKDMGVDNYADIYE